MASVFPERFSTGIRLALGDRRSHRPATPIVQGRVPSAWLSRSPSRSDSPLVGRLLVGRGTHFVMPSCFAMPSTTLSMENMPHSGASAIVSGRRSSARVPTMSLVVGLDFGTSAARLAVVDTPTLETKFSNSFPLFHQSVNEWIEALRCLVESIPIGLAQRIAAIAVDGTSATCVNLPSLEVMLYNEQVDSSIAKVVRETSPEGHVATSPTSSLCKLLQWLGRSDIRFRFLHQVDLLELVLLYGPDWTYMALGGRCVYARLLLDAADGELKPSIRPPPGSSRIISDWHNALKLGYDPADECFPAWLLTLVERVGAPRGFGGDVRSLFPDVRRPGSRVS